MCFKLRANARLIWTDILLPDMMGPFDGLQALLLLATEELPTCDGGPWYLDSLYIDEYSVEERI